MKSSSYYHRDKLARYIKSRMLHFLFVLLTIFVTSTVAQVTYRLPNNTRPESYEISIRTWVHAINFTFTGFVRIGIVAIESTNFVTLHHDVERLESVRVLSSDGVPIGIGDYSYNPAYDFLTIPVIGSNLTQGARYFIEIDYVGFMNSFSGFYRSFYDSDANTRLWFGSTHFEPSYARTAFPCYDELPLKSNFTIEITHISTYSAISNMPVLSTTPNPDGSVTTKFETTPPMSTYVVAFHVSNFPHVTSSSPSFVPQRIFSRSTAINTTDLALEVGELLMDALTDYIGIEYPLPKLDQIAVPGFPTGSMNNFGLITNDEFYMLYDENVHSFSRALAIVLRSSHEISHSWFGGLVSPSWWTYLWKKEGLARFFEYVGVDLIYSDWQMLDYFVVNINQNVFLVDADPLAQPLTYYVEHPTDINFRFLSIIANKGAAVLRMFWFMFGKETFMRGVTSYLRDNAFSDAGEEELFEAIATYVSLESEAILPPNGDVPEIMATWTRQPGFPLITVDRNYDDRTDQVILRQERYYSYPPANRQNSTWWVPYNLATPSNPGFENTLAEGWIPQNISSWQITVDSLDANDYLLINKQSAGYYRVIYDERNYRLISDAIIRNSSLFHPTNIAQLLGDALEFYETDRLTLTTVLDLLRVLEFRTDYISWYSAFDTLTYLNQNMQGHRNYAIWADFVRSLTEGLYDSVGVEDIQNEPPLRKFARESIVRLACEMGSVHCRSDATRQLRRYIETGEEFHQNIRYVLSCASIRSASRTDFQFIWNRLLEIPQTDSTPRAQIIDMLACSRSRPILNDYVRSAFNLTIYSYFEQYTVLNSIIRNGGNVGLDVTLDFFIENAVRVFEIFGAWFIQNLAYYVSNAEHIERFLDFQNILLDAGLLTQGEINFHMQLVAVSVRWLETNGEVINTWLMQNFN